ncbi:MAG: 2-oxoacid:acceptor oxidoreductase subunit alpha [Candidatus Omnitrophota bacterium]|nr:2-oxoacid:acceptor oxidoreductase subunit alpha [Candidatus Omnitrophota bacterium]
MNVDITIKIAGEAGQGLQTIGRLLAKAFSRGGWHVFANQVLQSRIRGGHNWFQVRVSDIKILAPAEVTDILIALDNESVYHTRELSENSITIFDSSLIKYNSEKGLILDIPFEKTAKESGGNKLISNTVALGAVLGLLEYDINILFGLLKESFQEKDQGIVQANIQAAQAGYNLAYQKIKANKLPRLNRTNGHPRMLINGSETIALGALAAGCKFISAYPMSPSTGIMTYLASQAEEFKVLVEQSEDEIASINLALGASYAGVRAMTATSGGGFALMVEGLSLAGMTETPIVIVDAQRPGPATGLPTRTAQEDLEYVIYAGHGESPRAVLAPLSIEDAFYLTVKAFNLADKYQIPVIILSDQLLADSYLTVDSFDVESLKIERHILSDEELKNIKNYKRYQITDSGISPRALPGNPYGLVVADSDEHDEEGHITEDVDYIRPEMVKKRNRKTAGLLKEMSAPIQYGPPEAKNIIIGWGSSYGALKEAVDILNSEKEKVSLAHFNQVWPLNKEYFDFLNTAEFVCVAENNFRGQFAHLIAGETGKVIKNRINKFNGLPFSAAEIVREYKRLKNSL